MTLMDQWRSSAYNSKKSKSELDMFWEQFFQKEADFYNNLLNIQEHPIVDTVENFAKKFNVDIITMVGFLDGLNDSLKIPNNIETITEKTVVTLDYDPEKLYKNAVSAQAEHIYSLSIWDNILPNKAEIEQGQNKGIENIQLLNIPRCQTCQSTNLKKISTTSKVVNTAVWGIFGTKRYKTFHCNQCGYEW